MPSKYTYSHSDVLRNKLGLSDPYRAHIAETEFVFQRVLFLAEHPIAGLFDLTHLRAIHRYLQQDMYDWAGELRDVDTGTTNTNLAHCRPEFLQAEATRVFAGIADDGLLRGLNHQVFVDSLAHHWGELTALHPFVDGNTRAQRVFVDQLAREAGWLIDWGHLNTHIEALKQARLVAHATADSTLLAQLLRPAVHPISDGAPRSYGAQLAGDGTP